MTSLLVLALVLLLLPEIEIAAQPNASAVISFGDSYLDVGINKYLPLVTPGGRCNQPPYGRVFDTRTPTGRFTDGELITDMIAKDLGLPFALPYLDPNARGRALLKGVNFASGGAGLLDSTSFLLGAAKIKLQLSWFRDYRSELIEQQGATKARAFLQDALYFFSAGSNDYAYKVFNLAEIATDIVVFRQRLISALTRYIREIYSIGARKVVILAFAPLGCIPGVITTYGDPLDKSRPCVKKFNSWSLDFNKELKNAVSGLERELPGANLFIFDPYSTVFDFVQNPSKYGFKVTNRGCCGTGLLEFGLTCNLLFVPPCPNGAEFIYFDSAHLTHASYRIVASQLMDQLKSRFS